MKDKRLSKIIDTIVGSVNPERIILFGSRSKGGFRKSADYDLAIDGNQISFRRKRQLSEQLEETLGLHGLDLIHLSEVDAKFRKIILNTGLIIYER